MPPLINDTWKESRASASGEHAAMLANCIQDSLLLQPLFAMIVERFGSPASAIALPIQVVIPGYHTASP